MKQFKKGGKVKVVSAALNTYWYADKIGQVFTLAKQLDCGDWLTAEHSDCALGEDDIELVQDDKESIKKFLKENKWFIRTGGPEKSKLVQEWLFEHDMRWIFGKEFREYSEKYLTNTDSEGYKGEFIMHGVGEDKTNAQEIALEFETVIKSVQLPEVPAKKTEAQLKLEELQKIIEDAQKKMDELKEEMK